MKHIIPLIVALLPLTGMAQSTTHSDYDYNGPTKGDYDGEPGYVPYSSKPKTGVNQQTGIYLPTPPPQVPLYSSPSSYCADYLSCYGYYPVIIHDDSSHQHHDEAPGPVLPNGLNVVDSHGNLTQKGKEQVAKQTSSAPQPSAPAPTSNEVKAKVRTKTISGDSQTSVPTQ